MEPQNQPPGPRPRPRNRKNLPVVAATYPWAGLTIDLSLDRTTTMPARLPRPLRTHLDPETGSRVSVHLCVRGAGTATDLVYILDRPGAGRTAFVIFQTTSDDVDVNALRAIFRYRRFPWQQDGDDEPEPLAEAMWHLNYLAQFFANKHASGETDGWSVRDVRGAAVWAGSGVHTTKDRAVLLAAGMEPHSSTLEMVDLLTGRGVSVAEIAYWAAIPACHYVGGDRLIETYLRHGLTIADVHAFATTPLDPTDRRLSPEELDGRAREIARSKEHGWAAEGRAAVLRHTPVGCSDTWWADIWVKFMPPGRAGRYALAGFSYEEAVRFEIAGTGPDDASLDMLAAFKGRD